VIIDSNDILPNRQNRQKKTVRKNRKVIGLREKDNENCTTSGCCLSIISNY
jgi:hypothetical protein